MTATSCASPSLAGPCEQCRRSGRSWPAAPRRRRPRTTRWRHRSAAHLTLARQAPRNANCQQSPHSGAIAGCDVDMSVSRDIRSHLTAKETECQPVAPSGTGSAHCSVWTAPVLSVARTVIVCGPALVGLPRVAPQPPGVVGVARAQARPAASALLSGLSMRTSTACTPRFCAHATPPNVTGPRATSCTAARHVDAGFVLIGPRADQPSRVQYASALVEPRQLEVDDPLGGRHVAVQSGDDQACGVAVVGGQRLTVHPDGQQRVAVVGEGIDGGARGEPVDRRRQHHVGVAVNTRLGQQIPHPVTGPAAFAMRSPPTGLDTHVSVTTFSTTSNRSRSSKR